ncbi:hypothetical protein BIWAKO_03593 [Bosea sp. BIWAKO-01]|nr:hypothetical protein BIWAKO_03593 [Bosea sp. BIWAKO-01]
MHLSDPDGTDGLGPPSQAYDRRIIHIAAASHDALLLAVPARAP